MQHCFPSIKSNSSSNDHYLSNEQVVKHHKMRLDTKSAELKDLSWTSINYCCNLDLVSLTPTPQTDWPPADICSQEPKPQWSGTLALVGPKRSHKWLRWPACRLARLRVSTSWPLSACCPPSASTLFPCNIWHEPMNNTSEALASP